MSLMSTNKKEKYPACFGVLNNVFPKSTDGCRTSPDVCLECSVKTECLKTAMKKKEGLKAREEFADRAYDSGTIGFFERWILKKNLYFLRKKRKD